MSIQSYLHLLSLNLRIQLKRTRGTWKGLQAFPDQNHQAHIEAHLAIVQRLWRKLMAIVMTLQVMFKSTWIYG